MRKNRLEVLVEAGLFASRWLLAPLYIGMAAALGVLLWVFGATLVNDVMELTRTPNRKMAEAGILMILSMIDLSLVGNLLLIVILSGYENFIGRLEPVPNRPAWLGAIDFSGLKIRLIGSIIAISSIAMLRTELEMTDAGRDAPQILCFVLAQVAFALTGVLVAFMGWLVAHTHRIEASSPDLAAAQVDQDRQPIQ